MTLLHQLFGEGRDLDTLQMAARAVVLFFVMLVLVHIATAIEQGAGSLDERLDLEEAVRTKANRLKLTDILEIRLESSGDLSVVEDVVGEARRVRTATAG